MSSAGCCPWDSAVSSTKLLSSQATQLSKREHKQVNYLMLMSPEESENQSKADQETYF
jgi:hypothetical protein